MKIAIIPARGGSKRIPRKNIKAFHGKPMIAYSIEAALASGCFDKVIVSTDDEEIAAVAVDHGAEVPFLRPAEISDDYATTMDVMAHAIHCCQSEGWDVEAVCCLYATAPFVLPEDLQQGYALLRDSNVQFTFSATSFPFPIQRAIKLDEFGSVSMFSPENEKVRSQDLEEAYHDAGQFYWGKASAFLAKLSIFSPHSKAVLLPRNRVQDIDTPEDWELAESLYSVLKLVR
ncbi:pseudaminic acid cytidylyltransferase [Vibrio vulnificus]|uniref:pseudaminic acid cytidylyltransferase n=1 Tax=Vibrio vulnificus TaxID=672 RepID=UPI0005F212BE|nr:pseudaminic acid cytidylyltransferase [Vibrio vulnificus]EGR0671304.1 pseudaminic acid cytidylyltransferase [Vibrio vulnificus]EJC6734968.1 pseudaminic acid cytidylyltransferase [Vibrio vulnificus]EJO9872763.1 pseudaminic acid cytidylyltransferase [Vibrio vulnificus]EKZ9179265.1 pseudaminic acid cytidylyltransferase [Vibrio vulnificus]ELV8804330.1 pseudaminic acid cytidylyltransferase [Vibrio vulnificus]